MAQALVKPTDPSRPIHREGSLTPIAVDGELVEFTTYYRRRVLDGDAEVVSTASPSPVDDTPEPIKEG